MRASNFDTFASPDTEDVALDRYFSGDLIKAIEDFLTKHFGASVQVFSSFESRFYVSIQGKKTAEFLRRVMKFKVLPFYSYSELLPKRPRSPTK
jgi:hypothetical protein